MRLKERAYWRTEAGDRAVQDETVPTDYRRLLKLIEGRTHSAVIRGCLRQFPDSLLSDWLDELEEIGYVASHRAEITANIDFKELFKAQRAALALLEPADVKCLKEQASAAHAALEERGIFLSQDRLQHREALAKKPPEISIYVVEDDPDQAALAGLRVSMAGYQLRIAKSCEELVMLLQAHELPDLLLADVMLPDGSGFDILASVRKQPAMASLPVILLTALADQSSVRHGLELGADGYMTKPYSKKSLADTIRAVLKHAE